MSKQNIYPGPSTSAAIPGGKTIQSRLASTPNKPIIPPPQPTCILKSLTYTNLPPKSLHNEVEKQSAVNVHSSNMSEEALQLVQFCNHCTFGFGSVQNISDSSNNELSAINSPDAHQEIPNSTTPKTVTKNSQDDSNKQDQSIDLCQNSFFNEDDEELSYPFITVPIGDQNMALSRLNSNNFKIEPGPPKELIVTKYKLHGQPGICRSCRSLDEAVRPVVYDWNAWWDAEHVICMMNEESYMNYVECSVEEDIQKILMKNSRHTHNSEKKTAKKKVDSSYLMPIKTVHDLSAVQSAESSPNESPRTNNVGKNGNKSYAPNWMKKMKQNTTDIKTCTRKGINAHTNDVITPKKVVDVCKSLKFIVSIKFQKLMTERQKKKYCNEGGKHVPA